MARRFDAYSSVSGLLRRKKFKNYGTLTTVLLSYFENCPRPKLRASVFVENGLCEAGKFTALRTDLCNKGIIKFSVEPGKSQEFTAGPELARIFNKINFKTQVLATETFVEDNFAKKEALQDLAERVSLLEKCIMKDIEANDPPATKDKLEARLRAL